MLEDMNINDTFAFPYANPGKSAVVSVSNQEYVRHAIKTHFIEAGKENYIDIISRYVTPVYKEGDFLAISEKLITLCQNRVITKNDLKIGFWAKFLSRFAYRSPYGFGIRNPYKMAAAIKLAGLPRVLFAAFCSVIGKLFGVRGVFYKVVGNNISNIDGFNNLAFDYYADKGLISPENPVGVCKEIKEKLNIDCMIMDVNDIGAEILGVSSDAPYGIDVLKAMVKDNPAGQDQEMTPLILIRKKQEYADVAVDSEAHGA
ncbi:F420-0:gamma-glutamyl ligase [Oxobacter pfennigii]|uniref:F420-0:gamma-glutamyl ligase n=1 Tax=Oxobacter pfennigii TaxID=36849 RepID=A0A0P8YSL7_9CLOT|nr:hypothetical protein [Oxobacter pfennigii]KPU42679.1 F420-0:gamma-glutamyl ligase [Oxobacter pfennigii]